MRLRFALGLRIAVWAAVLIPRTLSAETVPVRFPEGLVHGFVQSVAAGFEMHQVGAPVELPVVPVVLAVVPVFVVLLNCCEAFKKLSGSLATWLCASGWAFR